jgi:hypothetical protein
MALVGGLFGPAATALGQGDDCVARPDVAALHEYCSTPPGPDGRTAPEGPPLREVLPKKMVKQLEVAGPLGRALLGLTLAAPEGMVQLKNAARRDARATVDELINSGSLSADAAPPAGPVDRVVNEMTGSSGTSHVFRFGLLLATFALVLRRFRGRPGT